MSQLERQLNNQPSQLKREAAEALKMSSVYANCFARPIIARSIKDDIVTHDRIREMWNNAGMVKTGATS